jgi:hypothetical protein
MASRVLRFEERSGGDRRIFGGFGVSLGHRDTFCGSQARRYFVEDPILFSTISAYLFSSLVTFGIPVVKIPY